MYTLKRGVHIFLQSPGSDEPRPLSSFSILFTAVAECPPSARQRAGEIDSLPDMLLPPAELRSSGSRKAHKQLF